MSAVRKWIPLQTRASITSRLYSAEFVYVRVVPVGVD
jgi:hypothetical protein